MVGFELFEEAGNRFERLVAAPGDGLRRDDDVLASDAAQRLGDFGVGAVLVGGIEEADASLVGVGEHVDASVEPEPRLSR